MTISFSNLTKTVMVLSAASLMGASSVAAHPLEVPHVSVAPTIAPAQQISAMQTTAPVQQIAPPVAIQPSARTAPAAATPSLLRYTPPPARTAPVVQQPARPNLSAYEQRLIAFAQQVPLGRWACSVATDRTRATGRMAYLWSIGYAAGKSYPTVVGNDWPDNVVASQLNYQFDEKFTAMFDQNCTANPQLSLDGMSFSPEMTASAARAMKILSSYQFDDLASIGSTANAADATETYVTISYLIDGFLHGQFQANRNADAFVFYKAPEWLCEAFNAMSSNPSLTMREAALEFVGRPANLAFHTAQCTKANQALTAAVTRLAPIARPLAARSAQTALNNPHGIQQPPLPQANARVAPSVQQQRHSVLPMTAIRARRLNSQHQSRLRALRGIAAPSVAPINARTAALQAAPVPMVPAQRALPTGMQPTDKVISPVATAPVAAPQPTAARTATTTAPTQAASTQPLTAIQQRRQASQHQARLRQLQGGATPSPLRWLFNW